MMKVVVMVLIHGVWQSRSRYINYVVHKEIVCFLRGFCCFVEFVLEWFPSWACGGFGVFVCIDDSPQFFVPVEVFFKQFLNATCHAVVVLRRAGA